MVAGMNSVPHFELPLRVRGNGSFATLEQDFLPEIAQCVAVLLETEIGDRTEVPEYGVEPLLFKTEIDQDRVVEQIEEWEPRVSVLFDEDIDAFDPLLRRVTARVAQRDNT